MPKGTLIAIAMDIVQYFICTRNQCHAKIKAFITRLPFHLGESDL